MKATMWFLLACCFDQN